MSSKGGAPAGEVCLLICIHTCMSCCSCRTAAAAAATLLLRCCQLAQLSSAWRWQWTVVGDPPGFELRRRERRRERSAFLLGDALVLFLDNLLLAHQDLTNEQRRRCGKAQAADYGEQRHVKDCQIGDEVDLSAVVARWRCATTPADRKGEEEVRRMSRKYKAFEHCDIVCEKEGDKTMFVYVCTSVHENEKPCNMSMFYNPPTLAGSGGWKCTVSFAKVRVKAACGCETNHKRSYIMLPEETAIRARPQEVG